MALPDVPGSNTRKQPAKLITDFSNISQDDSDDPNPEATRLDLGRKIQAPREVMLEELSLLQNRGSRMFRMRQQRVDKFVYENSPKALSENSMNSKNLVSSAFEGMAVGTNLTGDQIEAQSAEVEVSQTSGVTPGVGGRSTLQINKQGHVKTYMSPWERAMRGNEELLATMKVKMPGPHVHCDLPPYKSFNRMALPFGDPAKSSLFTVLPPPDVPEPPKQPELLATLRDVRLRPSFNRTPIGWASGGTLSHAHSEEGTAPVELVSVEDDTVPVEVELEDL